MLQCLSDNCHSCVCHTPLLFFFATSTMASPSETLSLERESEEVAESSPLKRKCGAGRGGVGAKYCTMSLWHRKGQFPGEPFEFRVSDKNEEYLFCTCCGKLVSHRQKTFMKLHVDSKGHQQARKMWKLRDKNVQNGTPTRDVQQCVSTCSPVQNYCTLRVMEGCLLHCNFPASLHNFPAISRNFSAIFCDWI